MDELYTTIAQKLIDACPNGITKSWLDAELFDDAASIQCWYELNGKTEQPDIGALEVFEIGDAIVNIRAAMLKGDHENWSKCTITVSPDGQFKMNIHYTEPAIAA